MGPLHHNATCDPGLLSTKTADDATAEFVTGQCVFYQNGTWEYANVSEVGDDNLGLLPIYIGVDGEEQQGICTGSENYWCVNKNASEDDIKATLDSSTGASRPIPAPRLCAAPTALCLPATPAWAS